MGPSSSTILPSMRTRTKPSRRAFSSTSRNSPTCPRTSGASNTSRVPSGSARIWSTMACGVWRLSATARGGGRAAGRRWRRAGADSRKSPWSWRWSNAGCRCRCAVRARWRGTQTLDKVHVGLFELVEKLPRVGGKALDVAAAALGIESVKREGAFAGTAWPRDDHELAAGKRQAEILQIMLARPANSDSLLGHNKFMPPRPDASDTKDFQQSTARPLMPMNSSSTPAVPRGYCHQASENDGPPVSRAELLELHNKFRAVKHSACNALAVVMALSEMAERNPYLHRKTHQDSAFQKPADGDGTAHV